MVERLKRRILFSRPFRTLIGWGQRIVLPGFEGFSVYAISRFFFRAIGQGHLITRASAISFKLFMAFFPALMALGTWFRERREQAGEGGGAIGVESDPTHHVMRGRHHFDQNPNLETD